MADDSESCVSNRSDKRGGRNSRGNRWHCADPGCGAWNEQDCNNCTKCDLKKEKSKEFRKRNDGGGRHGGHGGGYGGHGGGYGGHGGGYGGRGGYGGGRGRRGGRREPRNRNDSQRGGKDLSVHTKFTDIFSEVRKTLDARHDKYERIVKLSRDITIESKRIIFTLHRIRNEMDKPAVLLEAEDHFDYIRRQLWRPLAVELRGEDPYQFTKAYSGGLQEWVEAWSFYNYLCVDKLVTFQEIQKELFFKYKIGDSKRSPRYSGDKSGSSRSETPIQEVQADQASAEQPAKPEANVATVGEKDQGAAETAAPSEKGPETAQVKDDKEKTATAVESDGPIVADETAKDEEKPIADDVGVSNISKVGDEKPVVEGSDGATEPKEEGEPAAKIDPEAKAVSTTEVEPIAVNDDGRESSASPVMYEDMTVTIPFTDFVLGLADLTGELMRNAINSIASDNMEICFTLLSMLQAMYENFLAIEMNAPKEVHRKVVTLKQSLKKVENACYAINVRGSEIPKSHLAGIFETTSEAAQDDYD